MNPAEGDLCQVLVDCIKKNSPKDTGGRLTGLSKEQWGQLLTLAKAQHVSALLCHRLRLKGLDAAVPDDAYRTLKGAYHRNAMQNLGYYKELQKLLTALKTEGIPLILLKGIYLADAVYGNPGVREMIDIDVLARSGDLQQIADILTEMGYAAVQPVCVAAAMQSGNHLPAMLKEGHAGFEIHWNLTSPCDGVPIDPAGLWERAVPVRIHGFDALALCPEDLLLHLCLHTAYQHLFAFGLRPSCDIAETIERFGAGIDWRMVTEQACLRGWQRGVYLALSLAKELAGAGVPEAVLEGLRPQDITQALHDTARTRIFSDSAEGLPMPAPLAELLACERFRDKVRIFLQRLFAKDILSKLYSVPMDSARIYFYYPRRIKDMLKLYGPALKKHRQGDGSMKLMAARTNTIADWLGQASSPAGERPEP